MISSINRNRGEALLTSWLSNRESHPVQNDFCRSVDRQRLAERHPFRTRPLRLSLLQGVE